MNRQHVAIDITIYTYLKSPEFAVVRDLFCGSISCALQKTFYKTELESSLNHRPHWMLSC